MTQDPDPVNSDVGLSPVGASIAQGLEPVNHDVHLLFRHQVVQRTNKGPAWRWRWKPPEYRKMNQVLTEYLGELADHIIADCIKPDRS
jgi:hypothetical protein